jgi:hypothetical protein
MTARPRPRPSPSLLDYAKAIHDARIGEAKLSLLRLKLIEKTQENRKLRQVIDRLRRFRPNMD